MEIIVINNENIKIILTSNDMKKLNISAEDLDYGKTSTKRALWHILDEAKQMSGFNTDDCRLRIQAFPSGDGGCEMFVERSSPTAVKSSNAEGKSARYKINNEQSQGVYILLEFNELCELCKRLSEDSVLIRSRLYKETGGRYILFIFPSHLPTYMQMRHNRYSALPYYVSEYGEVHETTQRALAYACEHCSVIVEENAVSVIAGLMN